MTDIMQLKVDGIGVYVKTHADAVEGLSSIQGPKGDKGDQGDAGQNATTTVIATQSVNGLMSAADKKKLDGITFTKVGTV